MRQRYSPAIIVDGSAEVAGNGQLGVTTEAEDSQPCVATFKGSGVASTQDQVGIFGLYWGCIGVI